jgi:hypothetical protein
MLARFKVRSEHSCFYGLSFLAADFHGYHQNMNDFSLQGRMVKLVSAALFFDVPKVQAHILDHPLGKSY